MKIAVCDKCGRQIRQNSTTDRCADCGHTAGPPLEGPWPKCATCSKPATCFGRYEVSSGPGAYACDDCCGHGNEDGVCLPLPAGDTGRRDTP